MMSRHHILYPLLVLCWAGWGGNVLLGNNLRFGQLSSDGHTLSITVAWDHAWNLATGPGNHDAVWLFAKVMRNGEWEHLQLAPQADAHRVNATGRIAIDPDAQGRGVMLRTTRAGDGDIAETQLQLQLAEPIVAGDFEIAIYGIEMAWVPTGPFWIGDGASNFCLRDSATGQPYFVASEAAVPADALTASGANPPGGPLAANFPKGYSGFYLMKYEISQQQYADFLVSLTYAQQAARMGAGPDAPLGAHALAMGNAYRNGLLISQPGVAPATPAIIGCNADAADPFFSEDDGQNRACNWVNWLDVAAYLDWAALRPITELEFEKACRGPLAPVAWEFAWGTDSIVDANTILNDGMATEGVAETATPTAGLGSHGYAGVQGPLRCGFGAHASSDRLQAGAGYYGHMELSGNLWEFCVTTRSAGLGFDGQHGDGLLSATGDANEPRWPDADGVGYKGGGWNSGVIPGFRDLAVSDRFYIGLRSDIRRNTAGGRGAR
jgi:formylglycine-generating enzyme required for sulfatase activity